MLGGGQTKHDVAEHAAAAPSQKQVFISYSHKPPENADFVRNLAGRLTVAGFSVWLDEEQVTGDFEQEIIAAANQSEVAVFVATERWAQRPWTNQEKRLFGERTDGVRLVVIAREPVTSQQLGPYLSPLNRIAWYRDDNEADARFWQVYCAIQRQPPGSRETWPERGRGVTAGQEAATASGVKAAASHPTIPAPRSRQKNDAVAVPCEGRPVDCFVGDDAIYVVTDLGEWIGISSDGFLPPLTRLSNTLCCTATGENGLLVGMSEAMIAQRVDEGWDYRRLPSPALSLCDDAGDIFAGTATGTITRLRGGRSEQIIQLREPAIALASSGDQLLVIGAQGLFGALPIADDGAGELTWLESREIGRPLGFFPMTERDNVGLFGATRLGSIDPVSRRTSVCPVAFEQGIRSVQFLSPQRWAYSVLADDGALTMVSLALDTVRRAPLPPGTTVAGCCGTGGAGLAAAWTREGRLYRIAAIDQDAECVVDGGVVLAAPMLGHGIIAALLWNADKGTTLKWVPSR